MRFVTRHVRRRPFLYGAAAAMYAAVVAIVALSAIIPGVTRAQATDPNSCFAPAECLQQQAVEATAGNCTEAKPCCNETRCYYEDSVCGSGQGRCLAKHPSAKLTVPIGATSSVVDLGDYIALIYRYSVAVAGMFAGVIVMVGGLQYLTARGDAGRVGKAKERIANAFIGLFLVLGAYLLLQTVNPDLVLLRLPKIPVVKTVTFEECSRSETCFACGVKYGIVAGTDKSPITNCNDPRLTTDLTRSGVSLSCVGKGCPGANKSTLGGFSGCSDATNTCKKVTDPSVVPSCGTGQGGSTTTAATQAAAGERYLCQSCTPDGGGCTGPGPNAACCTGFCSTSGRCTTALPGDDCRNDADCKSGICSGAGTVFGGLAGKVCTNGDEGALCKGAEDCRKGLICVLQEAGGNAVCLAGSAGQRCRNNNECASPNICDKSVGAIGFCADSGGVVKCPNGVCSAGQYCVEQIFFKVCTSGLAGAVCRENRDCTSGFCVNNICSSGRDGTTCSKNEDCLSKKCLEEGDIKICVNGGINSPCKDIGDCNQPQFTCIAPTNGESGFGRCVPSGV